MFAVSGGPYNPSQAGCNLLIKTHVAQLADSAQDIVQSLGWEKESEEVSRQAVLFKSDDPEKQKILNQLKDGPKLLDLIAIHTGFSVSKVATLLFELEMMGAVRPTVGKKFGLA